MKILFCGITFVSAVDQLKELLPQYEVVNCPSENLLVEARDAQVLIPLMAKVGRPVLEAGPPVLVQQWGVGLEGVDIESATELGIKVCNVPGDATPNADSTAEHAVFLMMGLSRKIRECFSSLRKGCCGIPVGQALFGKRALVVGFGKVGQALARKLIGLGMRVDVIRRTPSPILEREIGVIEAGDSSNLVDMARVADFVVSTVTLTNETRNLFDLNLFKNMKNSAFVVNVSRGPVINENDLIFALNNHLISGAGLDVFATEPVDVDHPLLSMENVLATPHIAGVTEQNYLAIGELVKENILKVARGDMPNYCVNF
ncbi:MAG: NAD(P)-dependent oxidoreductase [Desulfomonilaceae bacterium]